jgi:hypothetical protein
MAYRRQWLRPPKLREYYVDGCPDVDGIQDARYQVYWAVVDGRMRARLGGRVLSPEEVFRLRDSQWSGEGEDRHALPADIELSVEDALTIWGSEGLLNNANSKAPTPTAGAAPAEAHEAPGSTRKNQSSRAVTPEPSTIGGAPLLANRPRKQGSVLAAVAAIFPSGVPLIKAAELLHQINEWLREKGHETVKGDTVARALGRRRQ